MLNLTVLNLAFGVAAVPPMRPDTPPPLPVPVSQLSQLKTMQDVIAVAVLEDGRRAPAHLILPELQNRRQTLEFMRVHYPQSMRDSVTNTMPVAWVFVDRKGYVGEVHLVKESGYPSLDSLSLSVFSIAWFKPARVGADTVGVWVPYPARIPPYEQLMATLAAIDADKTQTPVATPFDKEPVVLNRDQVEAAIIRIVYEVDPRIRERNEAFARSQAAGGTVQLWVYINTNGLVDNVLMKKSSGNVDLDNSALQIARIMRFKPARNKGEPVAVWIEVPIKFKAR